MTQNKSEYREKVIKANIAVHSKLICSGDYNKSPHFLPENQAYVRGILENLFKNYSNGKPKRLLDFGCGSGFIIDIVKDLVENVDGVDITSEMLSRVDLSSGNITLTQCIAEETPFADSSFDFATAYSFMDHLVDYRELLREAYRVLRPGGCLYVDLNPNQKFISSLENLCELDVEVPSLVAKEIKGALDNSAYYFEEYGIDPEALSDAEPGKSVSKGFDAEEVAKQGAMIGFSECSYHYHWFFAEGHIRNQQSPEQAALIDKYLRSLLPLTNGMYKYIRFVWKK